MKRIIGIALCMTLFLSGCSTTETGGTTATTAVTEAAKEATTETMTETTVEVTEEASTEATKEIQTATGISKEDLKVGFIYNGDAEQLYTAAHYTDAMEMKARPAV